MSIKNRAFNNNLLKRAPVGISVCFFIVMIVISFFYNRVGIYSILIASFGAIFIALKYKLDQANYHKDLFEKRYRVFLVIQKALFNSFQHNEGWREIVPELDSVYRESYFLFGEKTYGFIEKLRKAIVDISFQQGQNQKSEQIEKRAENARDFLSDYLDGQKLAKEFPELKIDSY